jgi:hypothetical protein
MTTSNENPASRMGSRVPRRRVRAPRCAITFVLGATGCGLPPDDATETTASATSGTTTPSSSSTTGPSTTSVDPGTSSMGGDCSSSGADGQSSSATGGPADCEARNPEFGCAPIDCDDPPIPNTACGGNNIFDDDGCMRPWCEVEEDCGAGQRCFWPPDCDPTLEIGANGCYSPSPVSNCFPNPPMACLCLPLDCSIYGWCVPADEMAC